MARKLLTDRWNLFISDKSVGFLMLWMFISLKCYCYFRKLNWNMKLPCWFGHKAILQATIYLLIQAGMKLFLVLKAKSDTKHLIYYTSVNKRWKWSKLCVCCWILNDKNIYLEMTCTVLHRFKCQYFPT